MSDTGKPDQSKLEVEELALNKETVEDLTAGAADGVEGGLVRGTGNCTGTCRGGNPTLPNTAVTIGCQTGNCR